MTMKFDVLPPYTNSSDIAMYYNGTQSTNQLPQISPSQLPPMSRDQYYNQQIVRLEDEIWQNSLAMGRKSTDTSSLLDSKLNNETGSQERMDMSHGQERMDMSRSQEHIDLSRSRDRIDMSRSQEHIDMSRTQELIDRTRSQEHMDISHRHLNMSPLSYRERVSDMSSEQRQPSSELRRPAELDLDLTSTRKKHEKHLMRQASYTEQFQRELNIHSPIIGGRDLNIQSPLFGGRTDERSFIERSQSQPSSRRTSPQESFTDYRDISSMISSSRDNSALKSPQVSVLRFLHPPQSFLQCNMYIITFRDLPSYIKGSENALLNLLNVPLNYLSKISGKP